MLAKLIGVRNESQRLNNIHDTVDKRYLLKLQIYVLLVVISLKSWPFTKHCTWHCINVTLCCCMIEDYWLVLKAVLICFDTHFLTQISPQILSNMNSIDISHSIDIFGMCKYMMRYILFCDQVLTLLASKYH